MLKPTDGNAGIGVLVLDAADPNVASILSPTGLREIQALSGSDLAAEIIGWTADRARQLSSAGHRTQRWTARSP